MLNAQKSLNIPTINGLQSLNLDELTTGDLNADNIYLENLETSDITIDNDIIMSSSSQIIANGSNISDVEISYLNNLSDNVETRINENINDIINLENKTTDITYDVDNSITKISETLNVRDWLLGSNYGTTISKSGVIMSYTAATQPIFYINSTLTSPNYYCLKIDGTRTMECHRNGNRFINIENGNIYLENNTKLIFTDSSEQTTALTDTLKTNYDDTVIKTTDITYSANKTFINNSFNVKDSILGNNYGTTINNDSCEMIYANSGGNILKLYNVVSTHTNPCLVIQGKKLLECVYISNVCFKVSDNNVYLENSAKLFFSDLTEQNTAFSNSLKTTYDGYSSSISDINLNITGISYDSETTTIENKLELNNDLYFGTENYFHLGTNGNLGINRNPNNAWDIDITGDMRCDNFQSTGYITLLNNGATTNNGLKHHGMVINPNSTAGSYGSLIQLGDAVIVSKTSASENLSSLVLTTHNNNSDGIRISPTEININHVTEINLNSNVNIFGDIDISTDNKLIFFDDTEQTTGFTNAIKTTIETNETKLTDISYVASETIIANDLTVNSDFEMNGTNCQLKLSGTAGRMVFPDGSQQYIAFSVSRASKYDGYETNINDYIDTYKNKPMGAWYYTSTATVGSGSGNISGSQIEEMAIDTTIKSTGTSTYLYTEKLYAVSGTLKFTNLTSLKHIGLTISVVQPGTPNIILKVTQNVETRFSSQDTNYIEATVSIPMTIFTVSSDVTVSPEIHYNIYYDGDPVGDNISTEMHAYLTCLG